MFVCITRIMLGSDKNQSNQQKSTHPENSKLVRQVHVVQKVPPGSMIEQKNGFFENTIFVKNNLQKKVHLHLFFSCKI